MQLQGFLFDFEISRANLKPSQKTQKAKIKIKKTGKQNGSNSQSQ